MFKRMILVLTCATGMAQNVGLISLRQEESAALVAAYKAQMEAQQVADRKRSDYYDLTQKVRRNHSIKGCAAFTGDFRWLVSGAYSPLNSMSGVMSTDSCN